MDDPRRDDVISFSIALADDALILGQRIAEWVSCAPSLEEELALANVALDHIGRARLLYAHACTLAGDGRSEDAIAFLRDGRAYTNLLINELPRGDFAFTMVRQFLVDAFNARYFVALAAGAEAGLAAVAAKAVKECAYHVRRSRDWMLRLGDGTQESHGRTQRAADALWGYTAELFEPAACETRLISAGLVPDRAAFADAWRADVQQTFAQATLVTPKTTWRITGGRDGLHSEHLAPLLAQMQFLQRAYPGAQW